VAGCPRFSANRHQAGRLTQTHKEWIQRGFDDDVFLLAGSIQPQASGAIVACGPAMAEIQDWVSIH